MLQFFLNFGDELLLCGQVQAVPAGKDLLLSLGQAEFYHGIVPGGTQQDTDRGIFVRCFFHPVVIIYIHLQLAQVLVRQFTRFDLHNNKTLQQAVVQNQVDKKIITIDMYTFLPGDEGKTITEFQQKLLQMCNNGLLQVFFVESLIAIKPEKLQEQRIFNNSCSLIRDLFPARHGQYFLPVTACQQTLVQVAVDLPFQLPYRPVVTERFCHIKCPLIFCIHCQ